MRLQSIKFPTKKMKTNNIIPIGGHHLRMPSLTFLVCVAITGLLWVFVTFSREYTVTYDYKVVCSDIPEGRTEAVLSDSTFTLVFKSKGFTFLNPKFYKANRVLSLPVSKLLEHKGHNLYSYRFTKNEIKDYIKDSQIFDNYFIDIDSPNEITIYLGN